MEKLYPPNIAGTLPAFYGESFTIPFSHNRAVSASEIGGYTLKMKTIQSNKIVVLDDGKADVGTHNELLATNAVYREIHLSQFDSEEGA